MSIITNTWKYVNYYQFMVICQLLPTHSKFTCQLPTYKSQHEYLHINSAANQHTLIRVNMKTKVNDFNTFIGVHKMSRLNPQIHMLTLVNF